MCDIDAVYRAIFDNLGEFRWMCMVAHIHAVWESALVHENVTAFCELSDFSEGLRVTRVDEGVIDAVRRRRHAVLCRERLDTASCNLEGVAGFELRHFDVRLLFEVLVRVEKTVDRLRRPRWSVHTHRLASKEPVCLDYRNQVVYVVEMRVCEKEVAHVIEADT
jgi:hypothetical protein